MIDKLIERVRKNDRKAQEEFYKKFANCMFRIAYRYVNNEQDAADIINMSFFRIFKNMDRFTYINDNCTIGWMERIVINEALMFLRKNLRYNNRDFVETIDYPVETCSDDNLVAEDYYQMIRRLPDDLRTVFNMYAIDGFTHREIAVHLDIKEESSRVYLARARKLLQGFLAEKLNRYGRE